MRKFTNGSKVMLKLSRRLMLSAATLVLPILFGIAAPAWARDVIVAQGYDPESLWPNQTTAAININPGSAIVESLFWVDPKDNQLKPLLATGFELESDTSIVVKLREGVQFTNG